MLINRTFRLFISSTFSDFIAEREALQTRVFPRLEKYCAQRGTRFQAVDLRWGITEEVQKQYDTLRICLEEIRRCQILSPRPNFVVLLGNRYGWEPVPARIPLDHWRRLKPVASADQWKLIEAEYQLDENAIPAVYCLRPQAQEGAVPIKQEALLLQALRHGARDFTDEDRLPYFASATHQEIVLGALNDKTAKDHVYVYVRHIADLPEDASAQDFIDWDPENQRVDQKARHQLCKLETELRQRLEGHVCDMDAHWNANVGGVDEAYLNHFCESFYQHQIALIDAELQLVEEISELDERQQAHAEFGMERSRVFVGREQLLSGILQYTQIAEPEDVCSPLILLGQGGGGKSALLAKAVVEDRIQAEHTGALVVERYIGGVPGTESLMTLLSSLIADLAKLYNLPTPAIPENTKELTEGFVQALNYASAERPLHLYLDALDQLNSGDGASLLEWLPQELPEYAKLVVTLRTGTHVEKLAQQRYPQTIIEVLPLNLNEGQAMLDAWLADTRAAWFNAGIAPSIGRKLTAQQKQTVLNAFAQSGSALWLKLAYEEACNWASWDKARVLPVTVQGMIEDLIDHRLFQVERHPKIFTERALAYLTAGRFGLSEDELARVMGDDEIVRNEFQANERTQSKWQHRHKLPPVLWSRLYFDLQPYLGLARIDGALLMRWFHREFSEVLQARYLAAAENRQMIHGALADTFQILDRELRSTETNDDALFKATDAGGNQVSTALRRVMEQPWQLAQAGKQKDLQALLTDFGFCMGKCAANYVADFIENYRASGMVRDSSSMNGACLSFIIEKSHLLARGTVQWPAHKILLQLAIERADNDLLTLAAESWLNLGLCDWVWMRQINRPKRLQVSPLIAVMDGHSYQISKVVILPSFKAISWSYNKTIAFWNLIDGSLISKLNTFANSKGGLDGASMLTDSQIFCWSGFDLELWDIQKATQVSKLTEYSKRIIGAFSLNSKEILYWGHWGTGIWCPESNTTKMVQLSLNNYSFNSLELDNYRFVNFCKNKLQVIAKDTLQPVFELYHNDEIVGVEVIDKHRLCSWSMDRMIKIWNAITGEFEFEFQLETVMDKIEVLDAHTLAGSCSTLGGRWGLQRTHSIFIISISTRCVIQELVGHDSFISKVLRLPDSRLVSASGDTTLRLWREQGNEYIVEAIIGGHTGQINGAILLDNGFLLSWSDDNTIRIWDIDIATKQVYSESIPHYITNYLSFSSDKVVIAADCHMYTWQPLDSDPVVSMTASDGEKITNIKALPNDRVISASAKGLIQVWDIVTGNIEFEIYCGEPSSFEMLDHRRLLVRGSKTLQIWDLSNGQKLQTMATEITEFKYIPLRLSASLILNTRSNGGLEVWNLDSGVLVKELKSVHIHNNYIRTDTLGNDFFITIYDNTNNYGSTLCIWDLELLVLLHSIITPERINGVLRLSDDRVVCWGYSLVWVFDLHSFDLPLELQGHLSTTDVYLDYKCINGCIELTDGNFLTYSNDHTIRIWSGKENECELVFQGHTASVIYVKELPERRILSQSVNYEMIIWSMDSGEIIDRTKPEWLKQSELSSQWINSLAGTIEYRVNGPTRWDSLWVLQFNRNFLLGVYKGRSFRWYSTDQLRSPLCANGNAILAVSDRNVYRLGLWFGRDRIDIDLGVFVED